MSSYPENKKVCTQHTTATFNQTADLLNAMASGGGQNEYIWIKWTK